MFDISPVCQANLALWHAITGLITAVCGLEGTQAGPAALTGPDRLIRSPGTQNSNSPTPRVSSLAHNSLQSAQSTVPYTCSLTLSFCFLVLSPLSLSGCYFGLHTNQPLPAVYQLCLTPLINLTFFFFPMLPTHTVYTRSQGRVHICATYSQRTIDRLKGFSVQVQEDAGHIQKHVSILRWLYQ